MPGERAMGRIRAYIVFKWALVTASDEMIK